MRKKHSVSFFLTICYNIFGDCMLNLINIPIDKNNRCNKNIKDYLDPDYIYIPFYKGYSVKVRNNEELLMNSIALANDNKYLYTSVSGKIIGMTNNIVDGIKMHTIVVENNFEENTGKIQGIKKQPFKYTKDEVNKLINIYNAYDGTLKGKTMVINGIDNEPNESTYSYLISKHSEELLEIADALYNIFDVHKCFFAIKNNDAENVDTLINNIGTYPNINLKLMSDLYPMGNKDLLINELVFENKKKNGIIYLTVENLYAIYNVLKKNKPISEKLVTFGGSLLNKSLVMNVKIGSSIREIIMKYFKITASDYHIVINGLLSGYEIDSLDAIITPNIKSIFIEQANMEKEVKCINCGMCTSYCPFGCDPKNKYHMDKCQNCGICNYICPSKIHLRGNK